MMLYSSDSNCQKFVQVVQKCSERTSLCTPKVIQKLNFPKSLGLLCTWWTVVVQLYCHFSLRSQMALQQTANFQTGSFRHFRSTLRKDSVANYGSIWTLIPPSVKRTECTLQRIKRFVLPSVGSATRFANLRQKFSKTQKKIGRRHMPIVQLLSWENRRNCSLGDKSMKF